MREKELFVFVNVDLFLHEDGFTKLRELLTSPAKNFKPYSIISLPTEDEDKLSVTPFSGDIMKTNAIKLLLQRDFVLLSIKNLKILLSLQD